jgi:malate dehydrogenase
MRKGGRRATGFGRLTTARTTARTRCYNRVSQFCRSKKELALRKKVTVVGAGNVGANCALRIADKELADVVLVDVIEGVPQGKGLDLLQSGPVQGYDVTITGANDYEPTANSDIAILTAGFPRKPGMSRDDLLLANYDVVRMAAEQVAKYSPNCILIVVTNPLDAMAQAAYWVSQFSKNRVVGMAGILDSSRFRTFIAQELNVSVESVTAVVMGGHGDTMVPVVRLSGVAGIPLTELMDQAAIDRIVTRTRNGGAEIVKYLKTGSAYYAPSAAAVEMAESILKDKKKVLPCAAYLEGEYGINGLFVGVPVKLGARGIEQIYEIKLTAEEHAMLKKSADSVQELVDVLKKK